MTLPERGLDRATLLERLDRFRARDTDVASGRAFGYVYTSGLEADAIAREVYASFLNENALDPSVYPSLLALEREVVALAIRHCSGDERAVGSFTSGGTESIMLAVKAARDFARATRPGLGAPEMVLPTTGHAAFHKAADYLGVKPVQVDVDPTTFTPTPEAFERAIGPNTVLLVASAPSYAHGVIDPIPGIARVAQARGLPFHVDACVGGFLLPYFRRLGDDVPAFDFSVPGVTSISMDFHKYAFCAKGASVVLFRDRALRRHHVYACSEWTGYTVVNPTVQSSRSGGPVAAAWAVLHRIGDEGYLALARALRDATRRLVEGARRIPGIQVLGRPAFAMAAIASDEIDVFQLQDEMKDRGWYLQPQLSFGGSPANLHVSILPANAHRVDEMLADLAASTEAVRSRGAAPGAARELAAMIASIPESDWTPETLEGLLGGGGFEIPERMADITGLLDALPRPITRRILIEFMNELYSPRTAAASLVGTP